MQMKLTLIGWYNYDDTLFDDLTFPDAVDKELAVNTMLLRCGEFNVIYSNLDFLKLTITNWGERHYAQFEKMAAALENGYDPLYNYDRYEESTDSRTTTGEASSSATDEATVSADNASDYQPDSKNLGSTDSTTTGTDNNTHTAHLYGNIGVTTSQQMLESELELRSNYGIYDMIAASFMTEFCMLIY